MVDTLVIVKQRACHYFRIEPWPLLALGAINIQEVSKGLGQGLCWQLSRKQRKRKMRRASLKDVLIKMFTNKAESRLSREIYLRWLRTLCVWNLHHSGKRRWLCARHVWVGGFPPLSGAKVLKVFCERSLESECWSRSHCLRCWN